ncbi:hypothetical protein MNV49_006870 [Pseudohyphozyma bogoriensis]|nr:hypothetical protein MNV49_006870 [Pseudohyphozyma bogoriensis]
MNRLRTSFQPLLRSLSTSAVASTSSQPAAAAGAVVFEQLQYSLPRLKSGELPVYTDIKDGGYRVLTLVRKVEGNLDALAEELATALDTQVFTKPSSRQVVLKGDWMKETKALLEEKGF